MVELLLTHTTLLTSPKSGSNIALCEISKMEALHNMAPTVDPMEGHLTSVLGNQDQFFGFASA